MSLPTVRITYKGQPLKIPIDPLLACEVAGRRSMANGTRQVYALGLLALAVGWPGDRPWVAGEKALLEAAAGEKSKFESALRGMGSKLPPDELRSLKRDLASATEAWQERKAAVDAADVLDLPLDPEASTEAANRVRDALLADGVPAMILAQWAIQVVGVCSQIATAGFAEWNALDGQGFSNPPEEKTSSGGSQLPDVSVETPPAGSG